MAPLEEQISARSDMAVASMDGMAIMISSTRRSFTNAQMESLPP